LTEAPFVFLPFERRPPEAQIHGDLFSPAECGRDPPDRRKAQ